jgi:hypothetical protein
MSSREEDPKNLAVGEHKDESSEDEHLDRKVGQKKRDRKSERRSKGHSDEEEALSEDDQRRRKKKKKRRKERDDSSDDDDNEEGRPRKKRSKKRSRRKEDSSESSSESDRDVSSRRRRKRKKEKKRKKYKKKKKKSRRGSSDDEGSSRKDDGMPSYGKFGIIKATDLNRMQRSFQVWLAEVKGIPTLTGSRQEQLRYFADFCEDYNTATLPHKKFYDYDKWETEEYAKQRAIEANIDGGSAILADEARHKRVQQERDCARQEQERRALFGSMSREKVEEMKHQAQLRSQMQNAFRTGDKKTYERLKDRLAQDE